MTKPWQSLLSHTAIRLYLLLFARKSFFSLNTMLFKLTLRSMGMLNSESDYLSGERAFLQAVIKQRDTLLVLDVGANVGKYANRIKQLCPHATIYAFEPHPHSFARLQAAAQRHGYHALNLGCSDAPGTLALYDYASGHGSSHASLYREVIEDIHQKQSHRQSRAITVEVTTLDQVIAAYGLQHITILKIDTEGHELHVLRGAQQAIQQQNIDLIQFEFNEMHVISRSFLRDFSEMLPGYRFYRLLPDGMMPLGAYYALTWELFAYQNIVAVREGVEMG
jgi:FkbM family methyltransferase